MFVVTEADILKRYIMEELAMWCTHSLRKYVVTTNGG